MLKQRTSAVTGQNLRKRIKAEVHITSLRKQETATSALRAVICSTSCDTIAQQRSASTMHQNICQHLKKGLHLLLKHRTWHNVTGKVQDETAWDSCIFDSWQLAFFV